MRPVTALLALAVSIYLTVPFLWLIGASLSSQAEFALSPLAPRQVTADNYRAYLQMIPPADPDETPRHTEIVLGLESARSFLPAVGTSFLVGAAVVMINLIFGGLAAYGLARIPGGISLPLLLFYLVSRSVPAVAIMIPMYLLMKRWGLLDHPLAVILSHSTFTLPFTIWMLKGYFHTIPLDLERAARVDGCGTIRTLLRVFIPISAPALVAAGIFSFIFSWGEFLYALLFTTRYARTAPVILSDFIAEVEIPFPLIAAGGVLAVLIPVLLAFIFQRYLVRGIGGAVTG